MLEAALGLSLALMLAALLDLAPRASEEPFAIAAIPGRSMMLKVGTAATDEPYAIVAMPLRHPVPTIPVTLASLGPATEIPALTPAPTPETTPDLGAPLTVTPLPMLPDQTIAGVASFYNFPQQTASGDDYDPNAFTAAAQKELRAKFGGIHFGKNYQPAYALVEYAGKKIIVKFNDVGPLLPGRSFDLSKAAMAYLGGLGKGLLDVRVTPLPLGHTYTPGPVNDASVAELQASLAAATP